VKCTGSGGPIVLLEGGDEDTSESYAFAVPTISEVARTCVYDRANLGRSDPAAGPRGLSDLVGDVEALLQAAKIPGPYVLVGTSGGGYISAAYAYEHPDQVAGMVFVDFPGPFRNPPRVIVEETNRTILRTSNAVTTFRSKRTPGRLARGSATSRSRSSATSTRPRR
jgi:pimeloyl-ACP methyl ester carboxylesterase